MPFRNKRKPTYEQTTVVTSAPTANKDVSQTRSPPMARIALLMVAEILTAATAKKIVEPILMAISLASIEINRTQPIYSNWGGHELFFPRRFVP